MSVLHDTSTVLVDFNNVLVDTDLFVCTQLYNTLRNNPNISKQPIHSFFEIIDKCGKSMITDFVQVKKHINPFMDIIDESLMTFDEGIDRHTQKELLCDSLYKNILYHDYNEDVILPFTNIADTLSFLAKDSNLESIYIYMDSINKTLHELIYSQFSSNNTKVTLFTGSKSDFIKDHHCDTIIFNDAMDIETLPSILTIEDRKIDVLLLDTYHNRQLWDNYYIDGDGKHSSVCERFNINVGFIKVESNKLSLI